MASRQRGIGNLAFIAVLVLFIIAAALFVMEKDTSDGFRSQLASANQKFQDATDKLIAEENRYNALAEIVGIAQLQRGETAPTPEEIRTNGRAFLNDMAAKLQEAGRFQAPTRVYQVQAEGPVQVMPGDPATITLYGVDHSKETVTFQTLLNPMPAAFAHAAKMAKECCERLTQADAAAKGRIDQLQQTAQQAQSTYQSDVASKQSDVDNLTASLSQVRDQHEQTTLKLSQSESEKGQLRTDFERESRLMKREMEALRAFALNTKERRALALKEDPKDGDVLRASSMGTVYINLGRADRVSPGMRFTAWHTVMGGEREDVAVLKVLRVDEQMCEAQVIEQRSNRPVTQGMFVSNPFYDPKGELTAYVYGDLRAYPSDVARKRLADAGVRVSRVLDGSVDIIIVGEPPVDGSEDLMSDDPEAAAKRTAMARERRLERIMEQARSIQALVVTEEALRTFIDY